jgi:hypothetical protein
MKDLITCPEAAKAVNKSDSYIRKLVKQSKIKAYKVKSNSNRPNPAYKIQAIAKLVGGDVDQIRNFVKKDREYLGRASEHTVVDVK